MCSLRLGLQRCNTCPPAVAAARTEYVLQLTAATSSNHHHHRVLDIIHVGLLVMVLFSTCRCQCAKRKRTSLKCRVFVLYTCDGFEQTSANCLRAEETGYHPAGHHLPRSHPAPTTHQSTNQQKSHVKPVNHTPVQPCTRSFGRTVLH